MTTERIAVLGLGAMGSRMAARLIEHGHDVRVYNRSPDRAHALVELGARQADSPRAAAEGAAIVLAMVRDDEASRAVWTDPESGALAGLGPDAVAVECSTLTPAWTRTLHERAAATGRTLLEAPVVGTRPHAEQGMLTFLVGGQEGHLDRVRPTLEQLGRSVRLVGGPGTGMAMKLAVNALFAIQAAALAELLPALEVEGVSLEEAAAHLAGLPTASPAASRVAELMIAGAFDPNFPVELVAKDLGYGHALATSATATAPVLAGARASFEEARQAGLGPRDITAVFALRSGGGTGAGSA